MLEPKIVIFGNTACQQTVAMATRKHGKFVKLRQIVANNILGKLTKFGGFSVSRSGVIGHRSWRRPQKPPPRSE